MSAPVRARCFGVGVDGAGVGVAGGASVGGFALHEALCSRVAGVSDPHVVQFPRLLVLKLHLALMLCPNCRPPRRKMLKTGRSGRGGLRFGLNGAGHGVCRWADAPVE